MVLSEAPYLLIIIVVSAAVLPAEIACLRPRLHEAERMSALSLLLSKYCPNDKMRGIDYAQKSFHRTEIIRLDIETVSAKSKKAF